MIKQVRHSAPNRTSMKVLIRRVNYIVDQNHKNHANKLVLPSKNYNCGGQGVENYFSAIKSRAQDYNQHREGKRGKRTKRRWEEFCYSSPEGMEPSADGVGMKPCLNLEEREDVERRFLKGPMGRGPVRLGWHICLLTGRCDCHFLVGIFDEKGVVWPNDGFGHGKKNLKLELERIEEELLKELNRRRKKDQQLKTPRQRHRENRKKSGKLTFAQKLVLVHWDGTVETLSEAAERAGYVIKSQTAKSITVNSVIFKLKPKIIRYNIVTLSKNWAKEKAKLLQQKLSEHEVAVTDP